MANINQIKTQDIDVEKLNSAVKELLTKVNESDELSNNYKTFVKQMIAILYVARENGINITNSEELKCLEIGITYFLRGIFAGAIKYFEKAANEYNNSSALLFLGIMYASNDMGVGKDINIKGDDSILEYNKCLAYFNIAYAYFWGIGVDRDYQKAREYYEKTAENLNFGNPYSLYYLGEIYFHGLGVDKDYQKAIEYYQRAVDNKVYKAYCRLGIMYYHGIVVEKSHMKAIDCLEEAWKKDVLEAGYGLAMIYRNSEEIGTNLSKTVEYLQEVINKATNLSLEEDDINYLARAMDGLGCMHASGEYFEKDAEKAVEYFKHAADLGLEIAQYHLGYCHAYGFGVKQDYKKAKEYYKMAARQGSVYAHVRLINMYKHGIGTPQNFDAAIYWYKKLSELGNKNACLALANIYRVGERVEQDIAKSDEYFKQASKK